jgi:hypothetical protein
MSRLAKYLSEQEKIQVSNSFAKKLIIQDAIDTANEILTKRKLKEAHRDSVVSFLQEFCPWLWQAFQKKTRDKGSVIARVDTRAKEIVNAFLGKNPNASNVARPPHPPFSDEWYDMREDEQPYHNTQFDKAVYRELVEAKEKLKKQRGAEPKTYNKDERA